MSTVNTKNIDTITAARFPVNNSCIRVISGFDLFKPSIKEASTVPAPMIKARIYRITRNQPAFRSGVGERDEFMVFPLIRCEDRGPAKLFLINFNHQTER